MVPGITGIVVVGLLGNFAIRRVKSKKIRRLIFLGTSMGMLVIAALWVF